MQPNEQGLLAELARLAGTDLPCEVKAALSAAVALTQRAWIERDEAAAALVNVQQALLLEWEKAETEQAQHGATRRREEAAGHMLGVALGELREARDELEREAIAADTWHDTACRMRDVARTLVRAWRRDRSGGDMALASLYVLSCIVRDLGGQVYVPMGGVAQIEITEEGDGLVVRVVADEVKP